MRLGKHTEYELVVQRNDPFDLSNPVRFRFARAR